MGRELVTTYPYNNAGDPFTVTYSSDPQNTPSSTFTYDRRGRLWTVARNGISTTLAHNDINQLLSESYAGGTLDGLAVATGYDTLLRSTQPSSLNHAFAYDPVTARLANVSDGANDQAVYSYVDHSDLVGQITFQHAGQTVMTTTKAYDALNRLTNTVSARPTNTVASAGYHYNAANQRDRLTLADRTYWAYEYDPLGQVKADKRHWPDDTSVPGQQFEYTHDDIGNRTGPNGTKVGGDQNGTGLRSASYTPNALNEYTSRTVPSQVNVTGIVNTSSNVTLTVSINGQGATAYRHSEYFQAAGAIDNTNGAAWTPVTVTASRGGTNNTQSGNLLVPPANQTFQYDTDGNLTNDMVWNYTWDAENRLIAMDCQVAGPTAQHLTFEYDWQGRRIHKVVKDAQQSTLSDTRFLYDGWNLIAEMNAQGNVVRFYVWGLDLSGTSQGAGGVGGLLQVTDATLGSHFACYDGNGNVMALIKAADGSTTAQYEYGPFGEPVGVSGSMGKSNPFRWSSKYTDDETDLVYYGYRYYSPSFGRWVSRDPLGEEGGLNVYSFVRNQPSKFTDYLGATEQLYLDPETGLYGLAEPYDVEYLGSYRAVVCGERVPFSTVAEGAPFEHARLEALHGKSLAMTIGPRYAQYAGNALRGLPQMMAITLTVAPGIVLMAVPDPTCSTKAFGVYAGTWAFEALDTLHSEALGTETWFEQAVGGLGFGETGKRNACCLKAVCITIVALKFSAPGTGMYRDVGGHHVHAKKAFLGALGYNPDEAFAVSDQVLAHYGIRHADITPIQQRLFTVLDASSVPNNLTRQSRIAYQALVEAGIPPQTAKAWVIQSQRQLIQKGVLEPVRIPWGKK